MLGLSEAAEHIGFRTQGVRVSFEQLVEDVPLPCILHWNQNHFVVCYKIKEEKTFGAEKREIIKFTFLIRPRIKLFLTKKSF